MHSNNRGGINNFEPFKILEPTADGAWPQPKIDWSSLKTDSASIQYLITAGENTGT